jgi:hypothetical protein
VLSEFAAIGDQKGLTRELVRDCTSREWPRAEDGEAELSGRSHRRLPASRRRGGRTPPSSRYPEELCNGCPTARLRKTSFRLPLGPTDHHQAVDWRDRQGCKVEDHHPGLRHSAVAHFPGVLGELLCRITDPDAKYSIAVPDVPQFRNLWRRFPAEAKSRTRITALFVGEVGVVEET